MFHLFYLWRKHFPSTKAMTNILIRAMQFVQAPQSGKTFYLFEHIKSQDRPFYILVLPQVLPWLQCFLKKKNHFRRKLTKTFGVRLREKPKLSLTLFCLSLYDGQ